MLSHSRTRIHPGGLQQGLDEEPSGQLMPGSPSWGRSESRELRPLARMEEKRVPRLGSWMAQGACVTARPPESVALRKYQAPRAAV